MTPRTARRIPLVPLALAALAAGAAGAAGAFVPCAGPGPGPLACPDLVVDAQDLGDAFLATAFFDDAHCAVVEGMVAPGARELLRFTFTTPNVGGADLVVGAPSQHPEWFEWSPCHRHWHFREYADYRLWTPDGWAAWTAARAAAPQATAAEVLAARPDLAAAFRAGTKLGFCVNDVVPAGPVAHAAPRYTSCGAHQGLSVGWADRYGWWLDGQWIDVTGLPDGDYVLEAEVNAERLFAESSYANNAASAWVWVGR